MTGPITCKDVEVALASRRPKTLKAEGLVPSAVLVLLRDGPSSLEVFLTLRSNDVRDHKGQVSFPGGVVEPQDKDSLATALREAEEEVGLDPRNITVLGRLDDFVTVTGYIITPWVAKTDSFDGLFPRTKEIAECFAFPLSAMRDKGLVKRVKVETLAPFAVEAALPYLKDHEVIFVQYGKYTVWGATARILEHLLAIVEGR